ncbi:MAG: hypothetical protein ACI81O_000955, partial [Cyclobacteriaceae bacterium]
MPKLKRDIDGNLPFLSSYITLFQSNLHPRLSLMND